MGNEDSAPQLWTPRSLDLKPCDLFLWGFMKDAVYVPPLLKNLNHPRNHNTVAVSSVTEDIHHQIMDEFNYRLDVICAAGEGAY